MRKIRILAAAHDAGGAEIIAKLAAEFKKKFEWDIYAGGPAVRILKMHRADFRKVRKFSAQSALRIVRKSRPRFILTATSWSSEIERFFLKAATAEKITCAAFLDGWFNYRQRFFSQEAKSGFVFPDYILTGDFYAMRLARKSKLGKSRIVRIANPIWTACMKLKRKQAGSTAAKHVLYLMQAYSAKLKRFQRKASHKTPDAWKLAESFIGGTFAAGIKKISVRPHPATNGRLFESWLKAQRKKLPASKLEFSSGNLDRAIQRTDIVAGYETVGLVRAMLSGKTVCSYNPFLSFKPHLPKVKCIQQAEQLTRFLKKSKRTTTTSRTEWISRQNFAEWLGSLEEMKA